MNVLRILCVLLFLAGWQGPAAGSASAQTPVGAAFRAGTDGLGVNVAVPVASGVNLRAGGTWFGRTFDGDETIGRHGSRWEADGSVFFLTALADWHPGGAGFRLSGGLAYSGYSADGTVRLTDEVRTQGRTYSPEQVGVLEATVEPKSAVAPYVGLGWGNATASRWSFQMDLGVMYVGSPGVEMRGSGMVTPTASREQAEQIERNVESLRFYPVLSVGVGHRLFGGGVSGRTP